MYRFLVILLLSVTALFSEAAGQNQADVPQQNSADGRLPVSYGLVVDNSGSFRMLLERVITVVSDVIEANGPEDEAFFVTFVSSDKIVLRQELTDTKTELHDAAQNMFIEGGQTAILDAVRSSADYLAKNARTDASRTRGLVLVTDGEDRQSVTKIDDLVKLLKENNIRVLVIAMSTEKVYTKILDRLAKETGGLLLMPKNKAELAAAAKQVSAAIRMR